MNNLRKIAVVCFIYITCLCFAEDYIRVGSFNIANFGASAEKGYERSLISLVNTIRLMNADVIALQEIEPTEFGAKQTERLVKLLNKASAYYSEPTYDYIIAEDHTGDETVAFLWRPPVSLESEVYLLEHEIDPDNNGKPVFQRVPHYALFKAKNYDFYLVNCHLYTKIQGTSSEGRGHEYKALAQWLIDLSAEEEKDAIVVGDFNRFLNGKSAWADLMTANHDEYYRFVLLEAIKGKVNSFDPQKDEASDDKYSTTTSAKMSIYDQIIISKGSYNEFKDNPEFGADAGIIAFDQDEQYKWATKSWYDATRLLSDHRPVWLKVRIDKADDD